jgi:hypothetical protein
METPTVDADLDQAAHAERAGDYARALVHLQRAHATGRGRKRDHARVHWRIAAFNLRRARPLRALGQVTLVVFAATLGRSRD